MPNTSLVTNNSLDVVTYFTLLRRYIYSSLHVGMCMLPECMCLLCNTVNKKVCNDFEVVNLLLFFFSCTHKRNAML